MDKTAAWLAIALVTLWMAFLVALVVTLLAWSLTEGGDR